MSIIFTSLFSGANNDVQQDCHTTETAFELKTKVSVREFVFLVVA
jgi:hypothetical protein